MSTQKFEFSGIAKWCKCHKPDPKFNRYSLDLYLDSPSLRLYKKSGARLELRDDEEGIFIKPGRAAQKIIKGKMVEQGPPEVVDIQGQKLDKNVGNGSKVKIILSVYDTVKGKGSTWEKIQVLDLVEYNEVVTVDDLPEEAPPIKAFPTTAKKTKVVEVEDDSIPF